VRLPLPLVLLLAAGCATSPVRSGAPVPPTAPPLADDVDTDGDGIPDRLDLCPNEPEDRDGFQDEDGCPDLDNDGDGVPDAIDACPNNPGPPENRGCPVTDRDGDGVPDSEDRCPDVPGPRENQGCPDVDRDHDGIPDRLDRCPDVPGVPPDGCPGKYTLIAVTSERVDLREPVKFPPAGWKLLRSSLMVLDQVAQLMNAQPLLRLRVEGHTDSGGVEKANLALSRRRAEAVVEYLVSRGIAPARLRAVGLGSSRPIASNLGEAGRAQNRRIDFQITPDATPE